MKKKLGLILAVLMLVPLLAFAVETTTTSRTTIEAEEVEELPDSGRDVRSLLANIKFGGEVRMRGYEFNNFWTFDDDSSYYSDVDDRWSTFRLKSSLFASADLGEGVSGYIRFTNQTYGENVEKSGDNYDNKVFVENSFIDVKNLWGVPVDLRIGRQNLMYGSGFVLFDGQSQFASTSMYFDGIKGTYNFCDTVKLDAFYMIDEENNRGNKNQFGFYESGDDIYLYGAYLTATDLPFIGGKQEFYAMAKKTQEIGRDIKMFGFRLSDKFDLGIDYSLEAAMQRGTAWNPKNQSEREDHEAYGGKADLGYTFGALDSKPRIFGQYAYMSGDDEDTNGTCEDWDVFYGGWPQFGDLLAWTFVNTPDNMILGYDEVHQGGTAAYRNLRLATIGASCSLGSLTPKVSYTNIRLDQTGGYWYDDCDFGDYYQATVNYRYSKALSFAMYYAVIMPGEMLDDWDEDYDWDNSYEFFWEARLKF